MSLDRHLYLDVNKLSRHSAALHGFMAKYALWGGLVVLALMVVLAFLWARRSGRLESVVLLFLGGASSLIALGINKGVSEAVMRQRPCHALHHVTVILSCANDYSFPSDHSVIAGALATGLFLFDRRVGVVAWILALFLAFARVYAGVHYPGDVIGGLVLGVLVCGAVELLFRSVVMAGAVRLAETPLRPVLLARPLPRM
jgi:undecaprenyl-diphosphatase